VECGGLPPPWIAVACHRRERGSDLSSLCRSYLHLFGKTAVLHEIYYFSALAKHLEATNPDVTLRHEAYLTCLEDSGVLIQLSRFKKKRFRCEKCGANLKRHEEKETDVALGAKLLELFINAACDPRRRVSTCPKRPTRGSSSPIRT